MAETICKVAGEPISRILRIPHFAPFKATAYRKHTTYSVSDVSPVSPARLAGTQRAHALSPKTKLILPDQSVRRQCTPLRLPPLRLEGGVRCPRAGATLPFENR